MITFSDVLQDSNWSKDLSMTTVIYSKFMGQKQNIKKVKKKWKMKR